ncbi:hypothetical protein AX15_001937 [Amanita polypyramis BW_CC]|nr:hypothetical protein AX15_001937 [Amanita polypyramis BW_CC]
MEIRDGDVISHGSLSLIELVMALKPDLYPLNIAGTSSSPHTLDVFLDYVCPYSAKLFRTIDSVVKPLVEEGGKYHGKVKVIFRPQVQPWHATSTYTHEAGIAAIAASPENFYKFALLLFKRQEEFFDIPVLNLTAIQIRAKLAEIAAEVMPEDAVTKFEDLLKNKGSPNGGVSVTDNLKYNIKYGRQNSIHVSPTVLWDGLVAPEISSSWGEVEWTEFFAAKIIV